MFQENGHVRRKHILSIALEDYFHGPTFSKLIDSRHWTRFERRFEKNCLQVLDKLDKADAKATFFVNAWTAQSCPDLGREVIRRGHELALAGARNASFRVSSPEEFRQRIRIDRDKVEAACGRRVLGYRVTDVLLSESDLWALKILAEEGFSYDSSLSPILWRFAAQPWRRFVHETFDNATKFWEVPLSSHKIGRISVPIAGGNYFRQYPEMLVKSALKAFERANDKPLVLYFRLWDFDPEQPQIETGSAIRSFRHYRNSDRIVKTLSDLLNDYRFDSIANFLELEQTFREPVAVEARESAKAQNGVHKTNVEPTKVSVIIPCYNEEKSIGYLVNTLDELKAGLAGEYDLQFILVDDASKDQTWAQITSHFSGRQDTLLLRHQQNRGVAGAIMTGLANSREIACSMDCDCSYDPFLLRPMLKLLQDGTDLVTASPYHPEGSVRHVPAWRLRLSKGASFLYRLATGRKLYTFTACLRVYRRSAILPIELKHSGFLGIAELTARVIEQDKGIVEYPATLESRIFGRSKMKLMRTSVGHLRFLSTVAWSRLRRRFAPESVVQSPPGSNTKSSSRISAAKL